MTFVVVTFWWPLKGIYILYVRWAHRAGLVTFFRASLLDLRDNCTAWQIHIHDISSAPHAALATVDRTAIRSLSGWLCFLNLDRWRDHWSHTVYSRHAGIHRNTHKWLFAVTHDSVMLHFQAGLHSANVSARHRRFLNAERSARGFFHRHISVAHTAVSTRPNAKQHHELSICEYIKALVYYVCWRSCRANIKCCFRCHTASLCEFICMCSCTCWFLDGRHASKHTCASNTNCIQSRYKNNIQSWLGYLNRLTVFCCVLCYCLSTDECDWEGYQTYSFWGDWHCTLFLMWNTYCEIKKKKQIILNHIFVNVHVSIWKQK